ncbi:MAG: helicase-exonuclease AddAB subunit AddA [Clostridiales bacterium]|nr:helicase-exonuclease AddAB subunit AddA [Clostridiales bacterium]
MPFDWNDEQNLAIKSRNGTVLVSAAAGSGKSAVLVERVIERICDEENKCPADRLMIVTFTNAAAAGLRHKINKALSDKIKENPNNAYLIRQQRLLSGAVISTMDAFCGSLVRENFFLSDIEPDFRILDGTEEKILKNNAVDAVLEKYYDEKSDAFIDLLELFNADKDDSTLIDNIFTCYDYATAYDNPEKWVDELMSEYDGSVGISRTASGRALLNHICLRLEKAVTALEKAIDLCDGIDALINSYVPDFERILDFAKSLKELAEKGEWDALIDELSRSKDVIQRLPTIRDNETKELEEKKKAQKLRGIAKDSINSVYKYLPLREKQYLSDCESLKGALECFAGILKEFFTELLRLKKEENAYSFSDISHAALRLLIDENGNKTELAKELSDRFEEILIDEYQDTNRAQDMLFSAVSRDKNNMFIVGDVKQSIYRFRKAMPEIFIEKRDNFDYYDKELDNYPSKIFLDSNYRSRKEIIDTVNFFFSRIMNKKTGEIDYDENEYLNFEADYDERDIPCEIHHLRVGENGAREDEFEHIASEIERLIASKMQIKDGKIYRDIRYSDICVLMRKVSSNGTELSNVFKARSIPCVCEANEGFCSLYEVSVILSLLKTIDNPLDDVALLTTLFSPIYGFTPDELALIRLENGGKKLYSCLKKYAEKSVKAKRFLETLSEYKRYSVIYSASELLRRIYEQTAFDDIVRTMPNGERRASNLMHLLDYAESFEKNGNFSLADFMRFIDKVSRSGGDISSKTDLGETGNCVKIMSIHKSKGLEFPVVFIAKCNKQPYRENDREKVLLNSKTKLGVSRLDRNGLYRYPTLQYAGTSLQNKLDDVSEEIRVLYVAMTRAREKLYFVISDGANKISLSSINDMNCIDGVIHPTDVIDTGNFARWILAVALTASGCEDLRKESGLVFDSGSIFDAPFITYKAFYPENASESETEAQDETEPVRADAKFIKELENRINYVYPYLPLTSVAAKRTASGLNEQEISDIYFAKEKPAFMGRDSFTPAQRGTFTHLFMEKCDFTLAKADVKKELERLTAEGVFTPEQSDAVNIGNIKKFFESELYERMSSSSDICREKQFTVEIPASFFEDIETDEKVVVQGKIDCFFIENGEAVIVDYKTDYVKTADELNERYLTQMKIYKNAVEQFTGKKVKEVLLYSFSLGDTVKSL